ncbi:kinesin-like protein KIF2B [Meleagris gallopavo]|uniref:kinesin-like protein KIF2B n=1 Tax=Meleagris gallopavo TaxID=9103 RepID=UPI00093E2AFE|nr:kinesin-like protein KIF2B [Meleagris gallopavo]
MNSMASKFGLIQLGSCVEIKHSSGRTCQAVVTKLHESTSSITVEWLERGTSQAKQVDLQVIFDLNPHLAPRSRLTSSAETSLSARGFQSTVSESLPQPTKMEMCWDSRSPVVARPQTGTRWMTPCMWQTDRLLKQQEYHQLDAQEKPARRDSTSPHARSDIVALIQECRNHLNGKAPWASMPCQPRRISVCVRKRPLNQREAELNDTDVVTVSCQGMVIVHEAKQKLDLTQYLNNQVFRFDHAFDDHATNELVYRHTAQPLVDIIFQGGMATCFAYGQTGSGKTHTMRGSISSKGIYVLVAEDVFRRLQYPNYQKLELWVYGAFFEIYRGKVFDLLNRKKRLRVLEDGKKETQVVGLCEEEVTSVEDVIRLIETGSNCRMAGQTSANTQSSRSHAIFQLILKKRGQLYAKFSLIDLAGNERGADVTTADKQTRLEGADINKSLLALKECIRALGHNKTHTPFRASKLTQVLRDSLIGENSYTCMIATVSPGIRSCEHTLNTLRYANRVKELVVDLNSLKQPFQIVSSLPQQPRFGVQANKEALSKAFSSNGTGETLKKRKEINEKTLMEKHQKSLRWLKELLEVAAGTVRNVDIYAAQFQSFLDQEIGILTEIREKVRLFPPAACKEEQDSNQSCTKRSRAL